MKTFGLKRVTGEFDPGKVTIASLKRSRDIFKDRPGTKWFKAVEVSEGYCINTEADQLFNRRQNPQLLEALGNVSTKFLVTPPENNLTGKILVTAFEAEGGFKTDADLISLSWINILPRHFGDQMTHDPEMQVAHKNGLTDIRFVVPRSDR